MSIKNKMNDIKKELLLQEASKMFEKSGYDSMKIAELAKVAQVSVGTIYSLFNSKEGLYVSYVDHQINNFLFELNSLTTNETSPEKRIKIFLTVKFSYFIQKKKAIEQNATNNPFFFNSLYSECSDTVSKVYEFLTNLFIEINSNLDNKKALRMAFALNGLSDGYISQWLELDDELLDKVDEVSSIFIKMIKDF